MMVNRRHEGVNLRLGQGEGEEKEESRRGLLVQWFKMRCPLESRTGDVSISGREMEEEASVSLRMPPESATET